MKNSREEKIVEMNDRIRKLKEKKEELVAKRETMAPEELRPADITIRRYESLISSMEKSVAILSFPKPESSEIGVLTNVLDKYISANSETISRANKMVTDCENAIESLTGEIDKAMLSGSGEELDVLTAKLDAEKRKLPYLQESLARLKQGAVIPKGAVKHEWEQICEEYLPEWVARMATIRALAEAYEDEVDELIRLRDKLLNARNVIQATGKKYGCPDNITGPCLTAGLKEQDIPSISREAGTRLSMAILGVNVTLRV